MKLISVNDAAAFLLGSDGYLIYTHANPDGDTLGSALALAMALRSIGKQAQVVSVDGIPQKLSFLPADGYFVEEPAHTNGYTLISVDVAGPKMLGDAKHTRFALSIDHHRVNTIDCESLLLMADKIACGEIIFDIISLLKVSLTRDMAVAIYTAICSDSGGFRYEATTAKTHIIAAKCIEAGIDFSAINRYLFECKTKAQLGLIKNAYRNLELICNGRVAVTHVLPQEAAECGATDSDYDCINHIPREIAGVEVSAVLRQKGDFVKVSLRSNASVDVAEISKAYGGGGHFHAAGFGLDCSLEQALTEIKTVLSELYND